MIDGSVHVLDDLQKLDGGSATEQINTTRGGSKYNVVGGGIETGILKNNQANDKFYGFGSLDKDHVEGSIFSKKRLT